MNTELPGYFNEGKPVPRVLCHSLTGVTKFPDKGMMILQNFQKFRVRVWGSYRTCRSSGYRYEGRTELPEVPGTGMNECPAELTEVFCRVIIPGENNTPGTVCTYPTKHNLANFNLSSYCCNEPIYLVPGPNPARSLSPTKPSPKIVRRGWIRACT